MVMNFTRIHIVSGHIKIMIMNEERYSTISDGKRALIVFLCMSERN